ncbi:hypothetical protein Ancab_013218 [Ancistrocladus abbreviatus]
MSSASFIASQPAPETDILITDIPIWSSTCLIESIIFWDENETITGPVRQSAFLPYSPYRPRERFEIEGAKRASSTRKRLIEFLRMDWRRKVENMKPESERCYRHMMNERMRRQRHRDSYSAIHSMLPKGTKGDKRSIIEGARSEIEVLKKSMEGLEGRNLKVEAELASLREEKAEEEGGSIIKVAVDNSSPKLDSMLAVLKRIKSMGLAARSIQCDASDQDFSVVLQIDSISKGKAAEVEKAVQRRLHQIE